MSLTSGYKLTVAECETGNGSSKGTQVQGQEPGEGIAISKVEFNAGRHCVYLLIVEGDQPSGGRQNVPETVRIVLAPGRKGRIAYARSMLLNLARFI